jgi:hypothetical protein
MVAKINASAAPIVGLFRGLRLDESEFENPGWPDDQATVEQLYLERMCVGISMRSSSVAMH